MIMYREEGEDEEELWRETSEGVKVLDISAVI